MNSRNKVFVVGLDACDANLILNWSKEGKLPFLSKLINVSICCKLSSTLGLFSDSPWPTLNTSMSPAKHAFYNHLQIKRGTTLIERTTARHCRYLPFWSLLKTTGKKILTIDVPKTFPVKGLDGVQISAWGEHYPLLDQPMSEPADYINYISGKYGEYSHPDEITVPKSIKQEKSIYLMLMKNLEKKLIANKFLMDEIDWDLLFTVFSEGHYAGHQFYHLYDNEHWGYSNEHPEELKNSLENIYIKLDETLSKLFQKIDKNTSYFIITTHGLATNYSGNHLMPELLFRLGYQVRATQEKHTNLLGSILKKTEILRNRIPDSIKEYINSKIIPHNFHDQAFSDEFSTQTDWENTKAFFLPSDHFEGFISINLEGREPLGTVKKGGEFDNLCDEIVKDLKLLKNNRTGRPAVHKVIRTSSIYKGPNLYDLPDLVVQWADITAADEIYHPKFGTIFNKNYKLRKTKHTYEGLMIAGGKNINTDIALNKPSTMDIGPTILYLLGQPINSDFDGKIMLELIDEKYKNDNPIIKSEVTTRIN